MCVLIGNKIILANNSNAFKNTIVILQNFFFFVLKQNLFVNVTFAEYARAIFRFLILGYRRIPPVNSQLERLPPYQLPSRAIYRKKTSTYDNYPWQNEVRNSRVRKSSYETEWHKMRSRFKLLSRKFS